MSQYKRVEIGDARATIRWEGEVGDTGSWLGVEWDKVGRGKHDGVHKNVSYFTPVRLGNNCSFVRRTKVTNWGIGVLDAIEKRYGMVEGSMAGVKQENVEDLCAEIGARFVEVVGMDKINKQQSQIKHLRTASVRNMGVAGGLETRDIGAELPSLRDLDLSDSLMTNWSDVAAIVNQLKLHTVDLSSNLLDMNTLNDTSPTMDNLKHLILGQMLYSGYSWSQILTIAAKMPSLSVLQVHHNNIDTIPSFDSSNLANITEIDLDGNKLSDWSQIQSLSDLPHLQHLRLNGNKLTNIKIPPGSFSKLESLQLTDNNVASWRDVGQLDKLGLTQFRFRNNPVINSCKDEEVARQMTIARVSSLKSLNATTINQSERRWAEIDYLKTFGQKWIEISKIENNQQREEAMGEFLSEHNRYDEIVKLYGEPEPGDGVKVDTSIKASLLRLKIRSPEMIGSAETVKKIPSSMNVRSLRALLQRLYKKQAGNNKLRISLLSGSSGDCDKEVEIDNDMREISFYSVNDGDTLLVRWSDDQSNKHPIVTDL